MARNTNERRVGLQGLGTVHGTAFLSETRRIVLTRSARRHDNDRKQPRTLKEIYQLNRAIARRMEEVFVSKGVPVIPSIGASRFCREFDGCPNLYRLVHLVALHYVSVRLGNNDVWRKRHSFDFRCNSLTCGGSWNVPFVARSTCEYDLGWHVTTRFQVALNERSFFQNIMMPGV